jgi:hypothetical protein
MFPQWIDLGDENNAGETVTVTDTPGIPDGTGLELVPLNLPIVLRTPMPARQVGQDSGFRYWSQGKNKSRLKQVQLLQSGQLGVPIGGKDAALKPATAPQPQAPVTAPAAKQPDNSITIAGIKFTPLMLAALGGGLMLLLYWMGQSKGKK